MDMDLDTEFDVEEMCAELQEVLAQGGSAYVLSGEELEQFMDMDRRATHAVPYTMQ